MVERLLCKQEVIGSTPFASTRFCLKVGLRFGLGGWVIWSGLFIREIKEYLGMSALAVCFARGFEACVPGLILLLMLYALMTG